MVVKTKMADVSLVSRVRSRRNNRIRIRISALLSTERLQTHVFTIIAKNVFTIIAKNMAKTARRQLEGQHLLFGEYLRS